VLLRRVLKLAAEFVMESIGLAIPIRHRRRAMEAFFSRMEYVFLLKVSLAKV
jgi:hypothetical protein